MSLLDLLQSDRKTIFLDGAMGTQLGQAGLEMGGQNNITNSEGVLAVHKLYAACGVDVLITNTLTMNRTNLESHNVGVDVRKVNLAGVRLAREAAGEGRYVLGDMSSTGKMSRPYGQLAEEDAFAAFKEQAAILAEGGADGLIVETMFDLREALCAVRAAREACDLPIIASIAFNTAGNEGRTVMGNTARQCAEALTEAGASAVGCELREGRSSGNGPDRRHDARCHSAAYHRPAQRGQGHAARQRPRVRPVAGRLRHGRC